MILPGGAGKQSAPFFSNKSYRLFTPSLMAPGSAAVPVLFTGAPVGAPEVLA